MGFGFLFVAPHHPKTTPTPTTGSGPVPLKPHRRGPNPLGKNRLDAKRLAPRAHRHISSLKSVCSRISDHVLGENRSIAREICGPKKGARFPVGVPLGSLKNHPARQLRICFSPHKPWLCLGLVSSKELRLRSLASFSSSQPPPPPPPGPVGRVFLLQGRAEGALNGSSQWVRQKPLGEVYENGS